MVRLAGFVLRHRLLVVLFWVVDVRRRRLSRPGRPASGWSSTSRCPASPATRPRSSSSRRTTTAGPTRRPSRSSRCPRARRSSRSSTRSPRCSTRSRRRCRAPGWSTTPTPRTRSSSPRTAARRTRWSTRSRSRASPTRARTSRCARSSSRRARTPASTSASPATTCWPRAPRTPRRRACSSRRCSAGSVRWPCSRSCSRRSSRWCRCSSPAVSILTTFTIVLLGTYVTDISFVVQFLIALVGLGVAVDYSLLVVNRWREERAHGRDNHDAVVVAMQYAGHAVVASAGTVAISLCALLVIPVPLLRSMGIGGMLIPLVSTAVILTLLPALLGGIGPRVDWPRIRHEGKPSRAWTAWARLVVRWRWVAVGTALVILGALIIPIFGIKIGQAQTDSLASGGPAYEQLQTLRDGGVPGRRRVADRGAGRGRRTPVRPPTQVADRARERRRRRDGLRPRQRRSGAPTAPRSSPSSRPRRRSTPPRRTSSTTSSAAIDDVPGRGRDRRRRARPCSTTSTRSTRSSRSASG